MHRRQNSHVTIKDELG